MPGAQSRARFSAFIFAVLGAAVCLGPGSPAVLSQTTDKASDAIDRGIDFLLKATETRLNALEASGKLVPKQDNTEPGKLCLQVYALVVAGVSVDNPIIKRSFTLLEKMTFSHTYTTALYIFALDAAIAQMEEDALLLAPEKIQAAVRDQGNIGGQYRPRLQAAVESFLRTQNKVGVWRYHPGEDNYDNSNVQFAVLALGVGAKRHVNIPTESWQKIADHFVKKQEPKGDLIKERITLRPREERGKRRDEVKLIAKDGGSSSKDKSKDGGDSKNGGGADKKKEGYTGVEKKQVTAPPNPEVPEIGSESIDVFQRGWRYAEEPGGATWNMTCAGVSSLLLARENLRGKITPEAKATLDKAVRDGCGWLMGHWSPTGQYYSMYSLEKVGDLGEILKFGPHDWHSELQDHLVGQQLGDGSWPKGGGHEEDSGLSTAFALLILNRATSLLTMNPVSRIIISGKSAGAESKDDRSWVYVPDLNTTIHYPSLLRTIRQRPTPKLMKFLANIVDNYPDERKGELIPELAYVRDSITNKSAQKAIDDYLVRITGFRYKSQDDYMKWFRRWERIFEIAEKKRKDKTPELLQYYKSTTKSVPLKKTLMWALERVGAREAIPLLIEDMSNPELALRLAAYTSFRSYFLEFPPPFDANAAESTREKQVATIKEWAAKQQ